MLYREGDDGPVYTVDLVDETFIVADPATVALVVADPANWRRWWPNQRLTVFMDRGVKGIRWAVAGDVVGSSEIWLEAFGDGVILHYYLRVDPADPGRPGQIRHFPDSPRGRRAADRLRRSSALSWKQHVWELKRVVEAGREVGSRRADAAVDRQ